MEFHPVGTPWAARSNALRIARAVSLSFRTAGARSRTFRTRRPALSIRVARAERIGAGRHAAAWRVRYCAAGRALGSILIARAALLPVTTGQRESCTGDQDRFFHI